MKSEEMSQMWGNGAARWSNQANCVNWANQANWTYSAYSATACGIGHFYLKVGAFENFLLILAVI